MHTRYAIVTGGARGIGNAIVKRLHQRGDHVFVCDILDEKEACAHLIFDQTCEYVQMDVTSAQSIAGAFSYIFSSIPSKDHRLILVNNAGITRDVMAVRQSIEDWLAVQEVNLTGAFLCSQHALRHMMRMRSGYIINMSSVVGMWGNAGQAAYAASKGGLIALSKTLAREYGPRNICVNALAPGFIDTELTRRLSPSLKEAAQARIALNRFGTSDDVARLVVFLTSGDADYITGQVLTVDGGLTA